MILVDDIIGLMAKHHITKKDMAKLIGIAPKTLTAKMNKGVLGSDEMEVMIKALDIKDPASIFFANNVTSKVTKKG
jgi:DNA-binding XRE family transcriptional regulator